MAQLHGMRVFEWPVDWSDPISGEWEVDARPQQVGFGPATVDPRATYLPHGWEFRFTVADADLDAVATFLSDTRGRSRPFWIPGPQLRVRVYGADAARSFLVFEQGEEAGFDLEPGSYLWMSKRGEAPQYAVVDSVQDNGDGTETVEWHHAEDRSSSSSQNSSSSSQASATSSSSSQGSSASSQNSSSSSASSSSSQNSSSSGHSSSSSEGESSSLSGESSSSSSSEPLAVGEGWSVWPLRLVRLSDDAERAELLAERVWEFTLRVVELPHEYATAPSGPGEPEAPVYLYEFRPLARGDGRVWRYTNADSDVVSFAESELSSSSTQDSLTSSSSSNDSPSSSSSQSSQSGESSSSSSQTLSSSSSAAGNSSSSSSSEEGQEATWLAAPVQHGSLSRSTKEGGSLTVKADYDAVEPMALLAPNRLLGRLRLSVYRYDASTGSKVLVFRGVAGKASCEGRSVTASFKEWGELMDQKVPRFFVQPLCNWRVFEEGTCKADLATFAKSVTVVASSGRQATVYGASLAGLAEGHFAGGYLAPSSGYGASFVVASGAESGNAVALELASPYPGEVPGEATAVPGCDGTRQTCDAKFGNLDNFGGHATPMDNLTLVAIRVNTGGGGKK